MHIGFFLMYAVTCYLLNHVLQYHYYAACSTSLLGFLGFAPSPYCQFVDTSLKLVQWAPLAAIVPFVNLNIQNAHHPHPPQLR